MWRGRDPSRLAPDWVRNQPLKPVEDGSEDHPASRSPPPRVPDRRAAGSEGDRSEPEVLQPATSEDIDCVTAAIAKFEQTSLRFTVGSNILETALAEDTEGSPLPTELSSTPHESRQRSLAQLNSSPAP